MKLRDNTAFMELAQIAGWTDEDLKQVTIIGNDPVFYTRFRACETLAGVAAANGLMAAKLWELKTGRKQHVTVDLTECTATLQSFGHVHIETARDTDPNRDPNQIPTDKLLRGFGATDASTSMNLTDAYPTKDGRWFYIHSSVRLQKVLEVLRCEASVESIKAACMRFTVDELEKMFFDNQLCGAKVYTATEWEETEQAKILRKLPCVAIRKVADTDPIPLPQGKRPLSNLRVLESSRILSGPTAGRELASHGADVMWTGSPDLVDFKLFELDTGHGKRAAFVDTKKPEGVETLWNLLSEADVYIQNATLGSSIAKTFNMHDVTANKPGIIFATLNAFGTEGPWANMPGWEQILQAATGVMDVEMSVKPHDLDPRGIENMGVLYYSFHKPEGFPRILGGAFNDYVTGLLSSFGIMAALYRRATEGGSYVVETSLARSAMLLTQQELIDAEQIQGLPDFAEQDVVDKMTIDEYSPVGHLRYLRSCIHMSENDPYYDRPTILRGMSEAKW